MLEMLLRVLWACAAWAAEACAEVGVKVCADAMGSPPEYYPAKVFDGGMCRVEPA